MKKLTGIISLILAAVMLFSASSFAAVQGVKPPRTADETAEKWVASLGTSYADAPSIPVLSGDFIYCMSGKKIVKLDKESGETVASGNMSGRPTYAYVPVTVADGKVFCPIGDGVIEAFDAETLEKLWTSTDPLGGQAMTRIRYQDGRIYTGFWNSDVDDANFDCIDASDGSIIWSIARKGGYYWAECAIKDDYLILGGEDGDDAFDAPNLICCVKLSDGSITDTAEITGDVRSGITVSGGDIYLVTKGARIYKTSIGSDGKFGEIKSGTMPYYSTSTPVVYGGKIYVGYSGSTRTEGYIGEFDAETLTLTASVKTPGFPQCEMLVATGYDSPVIYSTYNCGPGGVLAVTVNGGKMQAQEIYTPPSGKQNYCISTILADENGDLYYKNDSGNVFALTFKTEEPGPGADDNPDPGPEEHEKTILEIIFDFFRMIIAFFRNLFSFGG